MAEYSGYNKILFIDDDKNLADTYNSILERKHLSDYLIYFDNAIDGINYLNNKKKNNNTGPTIYIMLDLYMPEMSGFEFLSQLDHLENIKDAVEVYVCTSSKDKEDRKKVMNYSFVNAYLDKPLPGDFLELLIRNHI